MRSVRECVGSRGLRDRHRVLAVVGHTPTSLRTALMSRAPPGPARNRPLTKDAASITACALPEERPHRATCSSTRIR